MATRPGKYAKVVGALPKYQDDDPERQDLINKVKQQIVAPPDEGHARSQPIEDYLQAAEWNVEDVLDILKHMTGGKCYASEFVRAYAGVRGVKDKFKEWAENVQLLLDAYEQLMIDQFEVEGIKSLRMEEGGSVSTHDEPYLKVKDKETFRLWCLAQGLERDMHLHPKKAQSLVKDMLLAGEPEPPGTEATSKTFVRLNKA